MAISNAVNLANFSAGDSFTVDSANDRVGIASTTPTTTLDVDGNLSVDNIDTDGVNVSGVVTATGGVKGIGISSSGISITTDTIQTLNFVGTGNTFLVDGSTVDISISGGSKEADPIASDISTDIAFQGGTGTQGDPFLLADVSNAIPSGSVDSSETVTISGLEPNALIKFKNNSTGGGETRFNQPAAFASADGTFSSKIKYSDTPKTVTSNVQYTGNIQIGTVYFRWNVTQVAGNEDGPQPGNDISLTPPAGSPAIPGSGTSSDPFILPSTSGASGSTQTSGVTISFTNQDPLETYTWSDENASVNGTRFQQLPLNVDINGNASTQLLFRDNPSTSSNTTYDGLLRIGDVYFSLSSAVVISTAQPSITSATLTGSNQIAGAAVTATIVADRGFPEAEFAQSRLSLSSPSVATVATQVNFNRIITSAIGSIVSTSGSDITYQLPDDTNLDFFSRLIGAKVNISSGTERGTINAVDLNNNRVTITITNGPNYSVGETIICDDPEANLGTQGINVVYGTGSAFALLPVPADGDESTGTITGITTAYSDLYSQDVETLTFSSATGLSQFGGNSTIIGENGRRKATVVVDPVGTAVSCIVPKVNREFGFGKPGIGTVSTVAAVSSGRQTIYSDFAQSSSDYSTWPFAFDGNSYTTFNPVSDGDSELDFTSLGAGGIPFKTLRIYGATGQTSSATITITVAGVQYPIYLGATSWSSNQWIDTGDFNVPAGIIQKLKVRRNSSSDYARISMIEVDGAILLNYGSTHKLTMNAGTDMTKITTGMRVVQYTGSTYDDAAPDGSITLIGAIAENINTTPVPFYTGDYYSDLNNSSSQNTAYNNLRFTCSSMATALLYDLQHNQDFASAMASNSQVTRNNAGSVRGMRSVEIEYTGIAAGTTIDFLMSISGGTFSVSGDASLTGSAPSNTATSQTKSTVTITPSVTGTGTSGRFTMGVTGDNVFLQLYGCTSHKYAPRERMMFVKSVNRSTREVIVQRPFGDPVAGAELFVDPFNYTNPFGGGESVQCYQDENKHYTAQIRSNGNENNIIPVTPYYHVNPENNDIRAIKKVKINSASLSGSITPVGITTARIRNNTSGWGSNYYDFQESSVYNQSGSTININDGTIDFLNNEYDSPLTSTGNLSSQGNSISRNFRYYRQTVIPEQYQMPRSNLEVYFGNSNTSSFRQTGSDAGYSSNMNVSNDYGGTSFGSSGNSSATWTASSDNPGTTAMGYGPLSWFNFSIGGGGRSNNNNSQTNGTSWSFNFMYFKFDDNDHGGLVTVDFVLPGKIKLQWGDKIKQASTSSIAKVASCYYNSSTNQTTVYAWLNKGKFNPSANVEIEDNFFPSSFSNIKYATWVEDVLRSQGTLLEAENMKYTLDVFYKSDNGNRPFNGTTASTDWQFARITSSEGVGMSQASLLSSSNYTGWIGPARITYGQELPPLAGNANDLLDSNGEFLPIAETNKWTVGEKIYNDNSGVPPYLNLNYAAPLTNTDYDFSPNLSVLTNYTVDIIFQNNSEEDTEYTLMECGGMGNIEVSGDRLRIDNTDFFKKRFNNTWNHLRFTRNGVYLNGVASGQRLPNNLTSINGLGSSSNSSSLKGYVSNFRLISGISIDNVPPQTTLLDTNGNLPAPTSTGNLITTVYPIIALNGNITGFTEIPTYYNTFYSSNTQTFNFGTDASYGFSGGTLNSGSLQLNVGGLTNSALPSGTGYVISNVFNE